MISPTLPPWHRRRFAGRVGHVAELAGTTWSSLAGAADWAKAAEPIERGIAVTEANFNTGFSLRGFKATNLREEYSSRPQFGAGCEGQQLVASKNQTRLGTKCSLKGCLCVHSISTCGCLQRSVKRRGKTSSNHDRGSRQRRYLPGLNDNRHGTLRSVIATGVTSNGRKSYCRDREKCRREGSREFRSCCRGR